MGMDIDIVKFDKVFFDDAADVLRTVYYPLGEGKCVKLARYRRAYIVKNMLAENSNCSHQCDFHELKHLRLEAIKKLALKTKDTNPMGAKEMDVLISDLRKIIDETDFKREVVAWSWS